MNLRRKLEKAHEEARKYEPVTIEPFVEELFEEPDEELTEETEYQE